MAAKLYNALLGRSRRSPLSAAMRIFVGFFAGPVAAAQSGEAASSGQEDSVFDDNSDVMDGGVAVEDFISTGRTGRRNAVADITDARVAGVSAAGMDFSFDQLSMTDSKPGSSDSSKPSGSDGGDKSQSASKS